MTLFELTSRNVKRNFRLYTIYLVSMIVSVMIYFTFVALTYNETLMSAMEYKNNFTLSMSIASTCTLLFIFMFVMYANGFFTRHRKKEFGTYLILGMKERQLSIMIFYENLIISSISIVVGVLIGGLLSKFFAMIVLKLMVYHEDISISFPPMAILQTAVVFLILSLVVSLQAFYIIRKVKLRELFYAAQKAENPIKVSFLLSGLSILLLGTAYYLISRGWDSTIWKDHTPFALITTAIGIIYGTYLLFRQFIAFIVYAFERSRRYVESDRLLWLSSIRSQIRSNATHLTFITLFSAMLLFFVVFVVVNYQVQFYAVKKNLPNTIAYQTVDDNTQSKINDVIKSSEHPPIFHERIGMLAIAPKTPLDVTFEGLDYYLNQPYIVSQTIYNKIIQLRGDDQKVDLEKNEAISLAQGTNTPIVYDKTLRPELTFTSNGSQETIQIIEKKDYALLGWMSAPDKSMSKKLPIIVVADAFYNKLQKNSKESFFDLYHLENEEKTTELSRNVYSLLDSNKYYSAYGDVYSVQIEGSSTLLFGSCFLAFIALFALASVIYFKQMQEATEARSRFMMLQKLGVKERTVNSIIYKQLLFIFLPPLFIGICHSYMILKYYILDTLQDYDLTNIVVSILAIYMIVYIIFYVTAVKVYTFIIKDRL